MSTRFSYVKNKLFLRNYESYGTARNKTWLRTGRWRKLEIFGPQKMWNSISWKIMIVFDRPSWPQRPHGNFKPLPRSQSRQWCQFKLVDKQSKLRQHITISGSLVCPIADIAQELYLGYHIGSLPVGYNPITQPVLGSELQLLKGSVSHLFKQSCSHQMLPKARGQTAPSYLPAR